MSFTNDQLVDPLSLAFCFRLFAPHQCSTILLLRYVTVCASCTTNVVNILSNGRAVQFAWISCMPVSYIVHADTTRACDVRLLNAIAVFSAGAIAWWKYSPTSERLPDNPNCQSISFSNYIVFCYRITIFRNFANSKTRKTPRHSGTILSASVLT